MTDALFVLAILCGILVIAEILVKKTFLKHLGSALLVILLGAVFANLKIIPSASNSIPLYDGIFLYVAPLSLFFLLLDVNLKNLRQAGVPMLVMFLAGTMGTVLGVWISLKFILGPEVFGSWRPVIGGMFAATYTGGGLNFNAVALHFNLMEEGVLYAGAVAVDNIITALWMLVCLTIPIVFQKIRPRPILAADSTQIANNSYDHDSINLLDFSLLLALGIITLFISMELAEWLKGWGIDIPEILILTTIALVLAQIPAVGRLRGSRVMGMFGIYLFLVVVGAFCELTALGAIGALAGQLLLFTCTLVLIHALFIFTIGTLLGYDWQLISVASQANIGGSTSALALTESFKRRSLLVPAVLVGSLGNALGTYLGFLVAGYL